MHCYKRIASCASALILGAAALGAGGQAAPSLAHGANPMLDTANTKVLSWLRLAPGAPAVVVSVNFTAESQTVAWSVPGARGIARTLLNTPGAADPVLLDRIVLGPFGVYAAEVR